MKKLIILLLTAAMCASLASCTARDGDTGTSDVTAEADTEYKNDKSDVSSDSTDYDTVLPDETSANTEKEETTAKTVNWQTATVEVLSGYAEDSTAVYSLYDMNSDKVPELIVRTGKSSADMKYYFYDLSEKSPKAKEFGMGSALLCGFGGNGVILQYARMGEETVTQYNFENGTLSEKVLFSRDVPLGEDYVAFTALKQYAVGDFSGLSWNANPGDGNADLIKNIK